MHPGTAWRRDKEVAVARFAFSRWPIKYKLRLCIALLLASVAALATSSLRGSYAYRELAKTISWRARELPLADKLSQGILNLKLSLKGDDEDASDDIDVAPPLVARMIDDNFTTRILPALEHDLAQYRMHLDHELPQFGRISDRSHDRETLERIARAVEELKRERMQPSWYLDKGQIAKVDEKVQEMHQLASSLRPQLYERIQNLSSEVRGEYQAWIGLSWMTTVIAAVGLLLLLRLFYAWVINPLDVLIEGSRRIAVNDDFAHRIDLATHDEMAELAESMNAMTARFLAIKTDQEETIRKRTQEVVRSEQLASVGFLAAGVAHEINNPLAAIAMCAESLESRLHDIIAADDGKPDGQQNGEIAVLKKYLGRIQDEAFRCKEITGRLLDFSRVGNARKEETDLAEIVQGVIDIVSHLGNYRDKKIIFQPAEHVRAVVNAQEMKQVVLNLIANALDSLDAGGTVWVSLRRVAQRAELIVRDNGCGMTPEVLRHLFEPFFTRRRDGRGTGLGLSITYRIIHEHGGSIEPTSDGPGKGSQMKVLLPLDANHVHAHERTIQRRRKAA
jgi:signal transduction histidine kinase